MDKLVIAFYTVVYLMTEYGRTAIIIITAFLSVVFAVVSINNGYYFTLSLVFMLAMLIAICRYYDSKHQKSERNRFYEIENS